MTREIAVLKREVGGTVLKLGLAVGLLWGFGPSAFGVESFSPESYQGKAKTYYKGLVKTQGFEGSLTQFQGEFREVAIQFEIAVDEYLRVVGSSQASELESLNADFFENVDGVIHQYLVGIIFNMEMDQRISIPKLAAVHKQIMEPSFLKIEEASMRIIKTIPKDLYSLTFQGFLRRQGGDYQAVGQISVGEMMELVKFMNGEFRLSSECLDLLK